LGKALTRFSNLSRRGGIEFFRRTYQVERQELGKARRADVDSSLGRTRWLYAYTVIGMVSWSINWWKPANREAMTAFRNWIFIFAAGYAYKPDLT
jgi:hypothetical protein